MRVTVTDFLNKKKNKEKITMLTAYDYPTAKIVDEAEIDAILVGDSLAMVVQGLENTLPVTMQEMLYHTKMVSRAVSRAFVIADMPYLSYQISIEQAVLNAGTFLKEAGAQAVKLEGGRDFAKTISAITKADIPVVAHIGLTPQSIHALGGYKVQGKTSEQAKRLMEDAHILQDSGAFALLLEAIPAELAKEITQALSIPTIGIGAGPHCDGQVLVLHDVIGLFERFKPKFCKQYVNIKEIALNAVKQYKEEVKNQTFPSAEHSW